jgi:hypothetical protein
MMQDKSKPSDNNHFHVVHISLLVSSFKLLTGKNIMTSDCDIDTISREIFFAPFAVMSHGLEADPIFNYANQCALDLFEMAWEDFIKLPSRLSAEADSQEERIRILKKVSENGYADDYTGVRISNKGKRFQIKNAIVWNVIDQDRYYGQAALIRDWAFL